MFNTKMLAVSMAVAITTGGLISQASASVPVGVAANDVGQVLLNPVFYARNGYTTDFTVTNTRTDTAVKAKVVFRSPVRSAEMLDFTIYLTPGDTWRGHFVTGSDGEGHIQSSDDSMRNSTNSGWASTDPVDKALYSHDLTGQDSTTYGHMEVIGVYAANGMYNLGSGTVIEVKQGMSKDDLKAIFDVVDADNTVHRNTDYGDCHPSTINDDPTGSGTPAWTVSSIAPCSVQLMGEVRIGNASDPNRASFRMRALAANSSASAMGGTTEAEAELAGYPITNPNFNAITGPESLIGFGFGVIGGQCAADNIMCIEHGIAADMTSFEYENDADEVTNTLITFPTKYRHEKNNDTGCGNIASPTTAEEGYYTPPFQQTAVGEMQYSFTSFDNSEMSETPTGNGFSGGPTGTVSAFDNEVNYHNGIGFFATSGWAKYDWQPETGCDYSGAPVVGLSYKLMPGTSSTQTMFLNAANQKYLF